ARPRRAPGSSRARPSPGRPCATRCLSPTSRSRTRIASLAALVLAMTPNTRAAELKMIAGGSMTGPLKQIVPQFEAATGHKLTIHFDSTPNLIKQATSGEPLDLAVVPVDVFKDAAAKARFVAGPTTDIARV